MSNTAMREGDQHLLMLCTV